MLHLAPLDEEKSNDLVQNYNESYSAGDSNSFPCNVFLYKTSKPLNMILFRQKKVLDLGLHLTEIGDGFEYL